MMTKIFERDAELIINRENPPVSEHTPIGSKIVVTERSARRCTLIERDRVNKYLEVGKEYTLAQKSRGIIFKLKLKEFPEITFWSENFENLPTDDFANYKENEELIELLSDPEIVACVIWAGEYRASKIESIRKRL